MAEKLESSQEFQALVDSIKALAAKHEIIKLPSGMVVHNFYNSAGMELQPYLDPGHMPKDTNFTTVIFSEELASSRGEEAVKQVNPPIKHLNVDIHHLATITQIAGNAENYDLNSQKAKNNRKRYKFSAAIALWQGSRQIVSEEDTIRVGVQRCGSNLLDEIEENIPENSVPRADVTAKRLRFKGQPDLLGAGVNITDDVAVLLSGKHIRLQEGVVAAGTTEAVISAELVNRKMNVKSISCDAVVICPVGAQFAQDFKFAVGLDGEDTSPFTGGYLDNNWYVRHRRGDELLKRLVEAGYEASDFIDQQVLGDGGDLSSNTS